MDIPTQLPYVGSQPPTCMAIIVYNHFQSQTKLMFETTLEMNTAQK